MAGAARYGTARGDAGVNLLTAGHRRHVHPYFWVPAGCETHPASGKPDPNAPPVPAQNSLSAHLMCVSRPPTLGSLDAVDLQALEVGDQFA